MKTITIILLALISNMAMAQSTFDHVREPSKQKQSFLRSGSDITAGLILDFEGDWGLHFQASNFYFQPKFSTQYRPDESGWDRTHTHNFGLTSRITNKIEVLYGAGFDSLWDGSDRKQQWHGTLGFAFRDEIVKIMVATDVNDEMSHDFSIGILFDF